MKKQIAVFSTLIFVVLFGIIAVVNSGGTGEYFAFLPIVIGGEGDPQDPPVDPPDPGEEVTEMVIFTLDREVTQNDRGFPKDEPPQENGNWETPVNFAEGTLYIRNEVVSQPVPQQDMRLQFCFWQEKNGNRFGLETCMKTQGVPGNAGTVVCWDQTIEKMWKKDNKPLEWDRERFRVAVPIKNGAGLAVSNFNGWEWNGEDPQEWYPLHLKTTVIIVAKDAEFSGWENYGGGCS
ncbi:MAG: hypothetical protein AAF490_31620 [Chloroflexota bacterium]